MRSGVNVIKGVRPDAMETAREAARRAGLSLGQWINSAIIGTAESATRTGEAFPHVAPSLRALEERITSIARDLAPESRATSRRLADAITRLSAKLDQLIIAGPTSIELARRVAAVDRALAGLNPAPAKAALPRSDWTSGLDGALAEISARQRVLDGVDTPTALVAERPEAAETVASPAQDLSGLERQLREITAQLETLRGQCRVDEHVASLRGDLADIGRKITDALPRRILEGLQAEIQALPERIDVAEDGNPSPELANVEQGLAAIRDALNALAPAESVAGFDDEVKSLAAKIDVLAANGLDPDILEQLEQAIGELRSIAGHVASGEAIAALATDVRQLGQKLDRLVDAGSDGGSQMEALARRVDALAVSLEARSADHGQGIPPNFDALINTLADRLEATRPAGPDPAAFNRLQEQIVRLAQKLDASDGRLGQLGAVERTMTDLMAELRDARDNAIEAAQVAARTAAKEMLDQSAEPAGDVDTIKQDIAELRQTQAAIDRRTQDTLEAVHGTLERMVDRLTMIESDLQDARTQSPRAADAVARQAGAASFAQAQPLPSPLRPSRQVRNPAQDSDLPADHPLEPGSGAPGRVLGTAAERIAASEAALGSAKPPAPAGSGSKGNFIAAARRAAQAAAADPSAGAPSAGEDRPSTLGAIGDRLATGRRPLILGIAAFLLVIGTLHVVTNMLSSGERPTAETPRPTANDTALPSRESVNPGGPAQNPSVRDAPRDPIAPPPATAPARPPEPGSDRRSALPPLPAAPVAVADGGIALPAPVAAASRFMTAPTGDISGTTVRPQGTTVAAPRGQSMSLPPAAAVPVGAEKLPVAIGGPDLRAAAAAGNAAAAYEIGIRYAEGRGVTQNFDEAIHWLDAAARSGLAPAQYRLGSLYEKGQGIKKDREAARNLYLAAAEKGNGKAMHNLAVLYAEGLEGKPDYETALQWFRKAADHGVSDSQYNLGILYARGIGGEQNMAESYKWFALAAGHGDVDAGKKRDEVAARLDPQSLVAARLAVQTWTADPQPDEAITVKAPAGGWDHVAATPQPAKPKGSAPVTRRTGSL